MSAASKAGILCFSSTDWDGVWGSRQQVMQVVARRGRPVLFIEQPAGLEHLARYPQLRRRKMRRWREGCRRLAENLWIASLPPLLPGRYFSTHLNRINQRLTVRWTQPFLEALGFRPEILWLYNPEQADLIGQFGERLSVYHCIDEFTAGSAGRKRRTIATLENELLRRVDVVFANSAPTYANKLRMNPNTYRIPSGVDAAHFSRALDADLPEHPALQTAPHPRLGYVGHINERLDYPLLELLAKQRPDWTLVFVGDPYPWTMAAGPLRRLRLLPNCRFTGQIPFSELPAALKGLDVCLLPYASGESAYYRSPLKLYEYLAAGKPVVAAEHPEARELQPWVYIAADPSEFQQQIEQALAEDCPEMHTARARQAQQHSWYHRVDAMERILGERLGG